MRPIDRVRAFALEIYQGNTDKVDRFLGKPHVLLDNRSPADVAVDEAGADRVTELLGRAAYGGPL